MLNESQLKELEELALSLSALGQADAEIQAAIDARKAEMLKAAETEAEDEVPSQPQPADSMPISETPEIGSPRLELNQSLPINQAPNFNINNENVNEEQFNEYTRLRSELEGMYPEKDWDNIPPAELVEMSRTLYTPDDINFIRSEFKRLGSSVPKAWRTAYEKYKNTSTPVKKPMGGIEYEGGEIDYKLLPKQNRLVDPITGKRLSGSEKLGNVLERIPIQFETTQASVRNLFLEMLEETAKLGAKNAQAGYIGYTGDQKEIIDRQAGAIDDAWDPDKKMNYDLIIDNHEKLAKLPVGTITGSGKSGIGGTGSASDLISGIGQGVSSVVTSALPAMTAGVTVGALTGSPVAGAATSMSVMGSQIIPSFVTDYNLEKAKTLYGDEFTNAEGLINEKAAINKLINENKEELGIPMALGTLATSFEYAGYKGFAKYFASNLNKQGYKDLAKALWATGRSKGTKKSISANEVTIREVATELSQLVPELTNEASAMGLSWGDGIAYVGKNWVEQAPEVALQTAFGSRIFAGAGKTLGRAAKIVRDRYPGVEGVNANSFLTLGTLKQRQGSTDNKEEQEGLQVAIDIEESKIKRAVKNGNRIVRKLDDNQIKTINNSDQEIKSLENDIVDLTEQYEAGIIDQASYETSIAGPNQKINNLENRISEVIESVAEKEASEYVRKEDGTYTTEYETFLKQISTQSSKKDAIDQFQNTNDQIIRDRDSGKITLKKYEALREENQQILKEKLEKISTDVVGVQESTKDIKPSSVKASEKLQEAFDKGIEEGDIVKDKDGKNVIGDKSIKQIINTQLPFINKIANAIYSKLPKDIRIGKKEDLVNSIKDIELLDLLRTYDGSIPLGAYLQNLLPERAKSKRALKDIVTAQFFEDLTSAEAKGMIAEEDVDIVPEAKNIETAKDLNINKNLLSTIKNAAKKALITAQEKVDNIKFKSDIAKSFKDDLYSTIKKELGLKNTKKNPGLTKAITTNPVPFYNALAVESMRMARTKDGKNPFEEAGFLVRNKDGVLEKKKYTPELKDKFLDYFTDPNLGKSTRSDRQMNLVEALAVSMGAREAVSLLESDIEFRERFAEQQQKEKEKNIIEKAVDKIKSIPKGLTEKLVNQLTEVSSAKNVNAVTKILGISNITVNESNRKEKQIANLNAIEKGNIPSIIFIAGRFANFARLYERGKIVNGKFIKDRKGKKYYKTTSNEWIAAKQNSTENKKLLESRNDWVGAKGSLYYGTSDPAYITALKAAQKNDKEYPNLKQPLRVTIPKGQKITKEFIKKYQERAKDNMDTLESFATILQDAVHEHKVPLEDALLFISSSYQATTGLIKVAAPFKYVSKKFEYDLNGKLSDRTGEKYREEHNPPASVIGGTLMWAIANNKVGAIMPSIRKNYYQTQLSKKDDGKIDRAKLAEVLPEGSTIIDNPIIRLAESGIDLNSIINPVTGKTLAQENNVESPNTVDGIAASNKAAIENNSDQVENLIDRAIAKLTELTGTEGTLQMNLANIPVQTIIGALRAVKLAYQGGKTLAQAIEKGYDKIKNYMSTQEWADFVSQSTQEVRNQNNPADVKLAILSEKGVAQMQEQSRKTDNALLKEFGIEIDGLSTDQIVEKLNILRKAKSEASNPKNPTKKARVFDFDDTLAKTDSKVLYTLPDGTEGSLNATEFAEQYESLKDSGATFDYSEFDSIKKGTKGPLSTLAKRFTEAQGDRDVFVLTARPAEAAEAIQEFLRSTLGIGIPLKNISGIENGTPGAKALWIAEKVSEGYNDIFFADDSKANVDAVEDMLTDLGVTKRVQQAKETGQKTLEDEMDTLIRTNKRSKIGTLLNKLNIYVPPGADDFAGLLQYFIGKGKAGEQQQKWFQDNLLGPFAKGIDAWTAAKVSLAQDYKALKKRFKNKKLLNEKVLGDLYTKEQAVRAYLYNKAGQDLGLNKADTEDLISLVEGNADLKAFADELSKITKLDEGYPNITKEWLGGNIGTDMAVVANISQRNEFLQEFINNKNQIFSDQNLKLIKQAYGNDFTNALENVLERMVTGQNRKKGKDKEFNSVMNWINQSVGAVMAVNMRSAVLQQLSLVNYMNWNFNNPFMMAKAMANVPQFLKDYTKIWNSPFLKERRGKMAIEVNMNDIADSNPGNLFLRMNKKLLELGFKPTQWGDSNAISFGGASWYRNRMNQLLKQGLSEKEADTQAMLEFQELSEETQQSSRVDRVSRQQASDIGRLILAFANTPLQYARLTKKATLDLINNRGDWKTNASKILYYGIAQNLIFTALQQGLFALLIGDDADELDEKEEKKIGYAINGALDGLLRGMGFAGATISALKNLSMEYYDQYQKRKAGKYVRDGSLKLLQKGFSISPPISKKIGDIVEAQKFETWRQYKNDPFYKGFAAANYVSGLTNLPADRVFKKVENLKAASDDKTEAWQSIFLALGWSPYNVNLQWPEQPPKKTSKRKIKKKKVKKRKSPIKMELPEGVLGRANKDGTIEIKKGLSKEKEAEVEAHEEAHLLQFQTGKLDYNDEYIRWKNQQALRTADRKIFWNGKLYKEGDRALPWEIEANKLSKQRTV